MRTLLSLAALAGAYAAPASGCRGPRSESQDIAGRQYAYEGASCAVHDPAIAIENGATYIFSTDTNPMGSPFNGNLLIRCLDNATMTLTICGQIFGSMEGSIPWYKQYAPTATNIWAPDVSFFGGLWHVYYAVSEFGKMNSVIGLATRPTLDPSSPLPWTDAGPILSTDGSQGYNAIDPSIVLDAGNDTWLLWGSFWDGIQLAKIDPATGKIASGSPVTNIANRQANPDPVEGAFLVYRAGYYYLFLSWNYCCRGAQSNYEVRVGRSSNITGPYVDQNGVSLLAGGGTHILGGANSGGEGGGYGWAAGGGESILRETVASASPSSPAVMVVHAYDGVTGDPWLNTVGLVWDESGWPSVVPMP